MKRMIASGLALLALLAASAAAAAPAIATKPQAVRSAPGFGAPAIGKLVAGERVNATHCRRGWCRAAGGYVLRSRLSFRPARFRAARTARLSPCGPGGRYYRFRGGWGCDYYILGLWPRHRPAAWHW